MRTTSPSFVPPHCPRSGCPYHLSELGFRFTRHGSFRRSASPQRIQRFRCVHCGHTFSTQSFDPTYWLKRPEVLEPTFFRILACSGYRQIAREARCSHAPIQRHAARLGRLALLYLHLHRPRGLVLEALVIDGFESFGWSQYHPLHLNLVVGAKSHYLYAFIHTELRRKGRMIAKQKERRAELEQLHGRPDPRGMERGMAAALALAVPEAQSIVVYSDEHGDYPRALRHLTGRTVHHERTPSRARRTTRSSRSTG